MSLDDDRPRSPASQDPSLETDRHDSIRDGVGRPVGTFSSRQIDRARDMLGRLYGARRAVRFYPPEHPAVAGAIEGLMGVISEYHDEGVDVPLTFFEDELLLGSHLLPEDSVLFDQLIRDMSSIGAGSVTFERGLDAHELQRTVAILASDSAQVAEAGGLHAMVQKADLPHVLIGAVTVVEEQNEPVDDETARQTYGSALDLLRDLDMALRRGGSLPGAQTRSVVRSLVDSVIGNRFAMLELAGLKDYDEYTFYHSVNVAILSLAMGSAISGDRRFLTSLGAGGLMHDVGKMTVEGSILNKPGTLSADEWAQMRLHPVHGAELVATMPSMDKASVVVILEHHMRYDGRGYPSVPTHREQHLASRIVAIADAFDAMTSRRTYSAARLAADAMTVLVDNMGTSFDPRLVRVFVRMMGIYPPRSVVRLDTGEVAIVTAPSETDAARPTVRIISGPDGSAVTPIDLDLREAGISIASALDPASLNVDVEDYL